MAKWWRYINFPIGKGHDGTLYVRPSGVHDDPGPQEWLTPDRRKEPDISVLHESEDFVLCAYESGHMTYLHIWIRRKE